MSFIINGVNVELHVLYTYPVSRESVLTVSWDNAEHLEFHGNADILSF